MREQKEETRKIVGSAAASARDTKLIETLYKTKVPETSAWAGHFFELTMGEEFVNGHLGYFVRETQCRWDPAAKHTVRVQWTLSPRGGFATIEEAHEKYLVQRSVRARGGFVHSYAPSYEATWRRKYACLEIPAETKDESEQLPED
jgi:hypothetical protein